MTPPPSQSSVQGTETWIIRHFRVWGGSVDVSHLKVETAFSQHTAEISAMFRGSDVVPLEELKAYLTAPPTTDVL